MPTLVTTFAATATTFDFSIDTDDFFATIVFSGANFTYDGGLTDLISGDLTAFEVNLFEPGVNGALIFNTQTDDGLFVPVSALYTPGGPLNFAETAVGIIRADVEGNFSSHFIENYSAVNIVGSNNPNPDYVDTPFNDVWVASTALALRGGGGDDILETGGVGAVLRGGWGDDFLRFDVGGSGTLIGGGGTDNLFALDGDDILKLGAGDDTGVGGGGHDRIIGGSGNDVLQGDAGNDSLRGGDDDDFLDGGTGDNRLDGGSGNDTLFSHTEGRDTLIGGDGADLFLFEIQGSEDAFTHATNQETVADFALILDFDVNVDVLELRNLYAADPFYHGQDAFYRDAHNVGSDVVYDDGSSRIKILDVQVEDFSWFNFAGVVDPDSF